MTEISAPTPTTPATPATTQAPQAPFDPRNPFVKKPAASKPGQESAKAAVEGLKKTQETAQEQIRKMKIKLYGKEEELPESEVIKLAQQSAAANKKWMEANGLSQKTNQQIEAMKDKTKLTQILAELGYSEDDLDTISEQRLAAKIQKRMMKETDPSKLHAMELEEKLKYYEAQERTQAEAQKRQEYEQQVSEARQEYDLKITEAMQKSNLPKNEFTLDRFVKYMKKAISLGYNHVTPETVAPLVVQDYQREYSKFFEQLENLDQLDQYVPKKFMDKIRKWDLQKLANPKTPQAFQQAPDAKPRHLNDETPDKKMMSKSEWKKMIEDRISG